MYDWFNLFPLFIKCSLNEFDTECPSPFDKMKRIPRIIISEKILNGLGYVEKMVKNKNLINKLIKKTIEKLQTCQCVKEQKEQQEKKNKKNKKNNNDNDNIIDGCPSCCHSPLCHEYNIVSSRKQGLFFTKE